MLVTRVPVLCMGAIILIIDLASYVASPHSTTGDELFVAGLAFSSITIGGAILLGSPSPIGLRVDERGFEFVYADGSSVGRAWGDTRLRVVFLDGRYLSRTKPDSILTSYAVLATFGSGLGRSMPLTSEAYEALVETALSHGVSITPADWNVPRTSRFSTVLKRNDLAD